MSESQVARVVHQIFEGIQYLRSLGIAHRDLKPANILLDKSQNASEGIQVKITDFGLSKIFDPSEKQLDSCGTLSYIAPEVLTKQGYSHEVDVWSVGCILYKMLTDTAPFAASSQKGIIHRILESTPDFRMNTFCYCSKESKDPLSRLLTKDPKHRI